MPIITVIITAYNRKEYLLDAVNSALAQTMPRENYEIVVVKNFTDAKIDNFLVENHVTNILEPSPYWNIALARALEISKGSVISFLDDDDYFDQKKLEVVEQMFWQEEIAMCKDGVTTVLDNGTPVEGYRDRISTKTYFYLDDKGTLVGNRNLLSLFNNSSMSVLRVPFERHIRRLNDNLPKDQGCRHSLDNFVVFSSLESGKCAIIPDKLTFYRLHTRQVTLNKGNSSEFYIKKLEAERLFRDSYSSMKHAFSSRMILERIDNIVMQTELQIALLNMGSFSFSTRLVSKAVHDFLSFREKYILALLVLYFMRGLLPRFSGLIFKSIIINLAPKIN